MLNHEQILLEKHSPDYQPLAVLDWALTLLQRCHRQSRFNVPADLNRNIDALLAFKKSCGNSLKFAAKNIPFAMIQAVTITVYTYGLASMLARNFTDKHHATVFISSYIPVLNTFQVNYIINLENSIVKIRVFLEIVFPLLHLAQIWPFGRQSFR